MLRRRSSSFSVSSRVDRAESFSEKSEDGKKSELGKRAGKMEKREIDVAIDNLAAACECYLANARYIDSLSLSMDSIKRVLFCIQEAAGKETSLVPLFTYFVREFLLHCTGIQSSTISLLIEPFFARVVQSDNRNARTSGYLALALLSSRTEGLMSTLLTPSSSLLESLVNTAIESDYKDDYGSDNKGENETSAENTTESNNEEGCVVSSDDNSLLHTSHSANNCMERSCHSTHEMTSKSTKVISPNAALSSNFSPIIRTFALQCLSRALHDVASLPPPLPLLDSLTTLLRPASQWLPSLLSTTSPAIQVHLFILLHLLLTLPSCEFAGELQQHAIDTGCFLRILRCALMDSSLFLRILARSLLVLLSFQNETAIMFLQRCLPRKIMEVLETGTFDSVFNDLYPADHSLSNDLDKEQKDKRFLPLQQAVWNAIRVLPSPRGSLDFPGLFRAYEETHEDYQLVWGDTQRNELQAWLDRELEKWSKIQSSHPQARWNYHQAAVRYPSYDYDLILFNCFLPYIASEPAEFGCSSLEMVNERSRKRLKLPRPDLFLTSLYARLTTARSNEKRELLLKCLRVVYYQFQSECGEFFDEEHVITMIREEVEGDEAVLDALVRFLQSLLTYPLNGERICRNGSWVPLLLEILMQTHANHRIERARVILDILYGELERATQPIDTTRLPLSVIVEQLSSADSLKILVDVLFLPSSEVVSFAIQLIYRILQAVPSCHQTLCQMPIVDALLLQPSLDVFHVQLLKSLLSEKALFAGILPDAVLYGLQVLSESRVVELYNGNTETALVIWNQSMRDHLQTILHAHIDPYIAMLSNNPHVQWEGIPLPHIHYPELDSDVYCGRYYLSRLIDMQHPTALKNPKGLLLALRNEWVREGKRRGLPISLAQAREILGVEETADEMTMIRAFWKLWRTDVDHGVLQLALDMLTGVVIVSSSPVPSRLYLIVQTQCFLYQHYHTRLHQFVFPSFKMLVAQIQVVVERPEQLAHPNLVSSLVTLVLLTCVCSVENAETFVQCGGLTVLYHLLNQNNYQENRDEAANQLLYQEVTILVHLSHHSSLHTALADASYITEYLITSLSKPLPISVLSSILKYFINLSSDPTFTTSLLHTSVSIFITAVPLLFRYNADEEKSREKQFNDQCNRIGQQLRKSRPSSVSGSSMTSDVALSAIPGSITSVDDEEETSLVSLTPETSDTSSFNPNALAKQTVQFLSNICTNSSSLAAILTSLLTPSLMGLVLEKNTDHLLSILNSDFYESPFIIWTESMRSQLLSFLQSQQNQIREGINHFSEEVSEFVYDAIRNELLIGDVYVRVFNEQKPKQFVKAPKYFMGLLTYLRLQRIGPKLNDVWIGYYESTLGDDYVLMMLTSLLILLEDNNELADSIQSADDLLLLFSFLLPRINQQVTWELDTPCTQKAIDILLIITKSPRIASLAIDQHASDIVIRILIQKEFQTQINIFKVLHHICLYANGYERIIFTSGLWLLFLHLVLLPQNDSLEAIREMCVDVFQGWSQNEEMQALCRVTLRRFLPEYMVSILTERTEDALRFFDTTTFTAEMIWNPSMKSSAEVVVERAFDSFVTAFQEGSEFVLDEDMEVEYEILKKEMIIGGVFISVYLNCEHYKLKFPQELMDGLMKEFCNLAVLYDHTNPEHIPASAEEEKKRNDRLGMVVKALRKECQEESPQALDYFASSGYVNRIVEIWEIYDQKHDLDGPIGHSCCSIILQVVDNNECATVLIRKDTLLRILKDCLLLSTENSLEVSTILLSLFKSKTTDLFKYVIELNMIPFLFSCVDNRINPKVEDTANVSSEIQVCAV